jgi:hypothetical protein
MKLEKWALVAEISSGIAVVFTLVILIFGIQDNTNATRGSVYATSIESLNALNRTIMADSELSRIYSAFFQGRASELEGLDRVRLNNIVVTMFRTYDMAYSMDKYNLFGENESDGRPFAKIRNQSIREEE